MIKRVAFFGTIVLAVIVSADGLLAQDSSPPPFETTVNTVPDKTGNLRAHSEAGEFSVAVKCAQVTKLLVKKTDGDMSDVSLMTCPNGENIYVATVGRMRGGKDVAIRAMDQFKKFGPLSEADDKVSTQPLMDSKNCNWTKVVQSNESVITLVFGINNLTASSAKCETAKADALKYFDSIVFDSK